MGPGFADICVSPAEVTLDCESDFVTLVWTESRPQFNTSLLRLGSCPPTSQSERRAVFTVGLNDCGFRMQVTGDQLLYTNDLAYTSSPGSPVEPFAQEVFCVYDR